MKISIRIVSLVLLLAASTFLPTRSAAAAGGFDGQVIFGQSFTLKSGDELDGDLVIFGGSATIEKDAAVKGSIILFGGSATIEDGAVVRGDIVLFGGSLNVDGEVIGDVVVGGGSVNLGASAHLRGNLATLAASLDRATGSRVSGQIYNTATSWVGSSGNGDLPQLPVVNPPMPVVPNISIDSNPIMSMLHAFWATIGQALAFALLSMLVMLFLAPQADRVAQAVIAQPLTAGGLGLLTLVVAPIALVFLSITIILIPVALLVLLVLSVTAVFGWIAVGYEIGRRFTQAIHQEWHPAFSTGLGAFALTLVSKALTGIPVLNCVGWLIPFLLGLAAFGAVMMTRFGTQALAAPTEAIAVVPSGQGTL